MILRTDERGMRCADLPGKYNTTTIFDMFGEGSQIPILGVNGTWISMAQVDDAIALLRYFKAHGRLPESIDDLRREFPEVTSECPGTS